VGLSSHKIKQTNIDTYEEMGLGPTLAHMLALDLTGNETTAASPVNCPQNQIDRSPTRPTVGVGTVQG
jgi:hypothetical protein